MNSEVILRFMVRKIISTVLLLVALIHISACAQESSLSLKSQAGEVRFSTQEQGYWTRLFFVKNGVPVQLFAAESSYFDGVSESDYSINKAYLKINRLVRGTVYGNGEEEYERAYCVFVEMLSGCVLRQETGSFCGGAWGGEETTWIWVGEEINIDERVAGNALSESDLVSFAEVGGVDNAERCASVKEYK